MKATAATPAHCHRRLFAGTGKQGRVYKEEQLQSRRQMLYIRKVYFYPTKELPGEKKLEPGEHGYCPTVATST
eukprot:scaffold4557_cov142-Amphora_coffeaeformis.AAC.2